VKQRSLKKRVDQFLVDKGFFPSRARAQAAILEGLVFAQGKRISKPGTFLSADTSLEVKGEVCPYVGRGGIKLEHALKVFNLKVKGKVALDVGASTGGFTDCLLQHGVKKVYAVDVGYGQLAWKLRQDPRVVPIERTNVRYLTLEELKKKVGEEKFQTPNFATIDVSFISLTKVLPAVYKLLAKKAQVLALVKPQFEAPKEKVGKGGIVKEEEVRHSAVEKVKTFAETLGFKARGTVPSPITGAEGNVEIFLYLTKG
jgi:23S rRNA (cytidine1920-2'-O)/16S rRNA (cytidine1409-2'-O)-methyltransferase